MKFFHYRNLLIAALLTLGVSQSACKPDNTTAEESSAEESAAAYTCPMHPEVRGEQGDSCPICGMDLVPVEDGSEGSQTESDAGEDSTPYTCPMHPEVRGEEGDSCPICGMDLVPASDGNEDSDISLQPSERALALMNIRTSPVRRRAVGDDLRVTGRLAVDAGREARITAWASGRLDRLYVETVGEKVSYGQPIARMHSHEISVAAADLQRATRTVEQAEEGSLRHRTAVNTADAARALLEQMGLSARQIERYAEGEASTEHVTIYAPQSGTVLERNASEGDWVQQGEVILSVADLDQVWAELEVYQEQLGTVDEGDAVTLTIPGVSHPVEGTIDLIEPVVSGDRRVGIARVELDNNEGRLRPDTLVRARIHRGSGSSEEVVTVPSTAVLWTGERSLVYVKDTSVSPPVYMPIEVSIGRQLGDETEILEGVFPGETVVTNGAFRLDASLQIRGGASMMAPKRTSDREGSSSSPADHGGQHEH
jgi:Cu(I)/Ag(I) efflux system membrane fusion protein